MSAPSIFVLGTPLTCFAHFSEPRSLPIDFLWMVQARTPSAQGLPFYVLHIDNPPDTCNEGRDNHGSTDPIPCSRLHGIPWIQAPIFMPHLGRHSRIRRSLALIQQSRHPAYTHVCIPNSSASTMSHGLSSTNKHDSGDAFAVSKATW